MTAQKVWRATAFCSNPCFAWQTESLNYSVDAGLFRQCMRRQHSAATIEIDRFELPLGSVARPLRSKKARGSRDTADALQFVDRRLLRACGGNGGSGMLSFLSVKYKEFCGADGGDGGNGGHVVLQAKNNVKDLSKLTKEMHAKSGENGHSKNCHGTCGDDLFLEVPLGTHVVDVSRGRLIAELNTDGQKFVAARGGLGGKGNAFFMNNENRAPAVRELGAPGEIKLLDIEMKSIADVGFIGYPNAGKSTLLRAISRARPKVASYPFTTLRPHIGNIPYDDYSSITFADIPGIIEDAHKNRGLGIEFLRHIQRCFCLVYVVDVSQPDALETFLMLRDECRHFDPSLLERRALIVANKIDEDCAKDNFEGFRRELESEFEVVTISARFGWNLTYFLNRVKALYDDEKIRRKVL